VVATDDATIETVRSFNRSVTQRVGALNEHYLGRSRPLGEARVFWEIGERGCDVRLLRARLGLDGYLSRLLRSLEGAALITVTPSSDDRRVRRAQLTKTGRAELTMLNQRSDALAESMLSTLTSAQQERLVTAMAEVHGLLSAAAIEISQVDPDQPDARRCMSACYAELDQRFLSGFDPAAGDSLEPGEMRTPAAILLVATLAKTAVGCGVLRFHSEGWAEIKRLWVDNSMRGLGIGRRLLGELEIRAAQLGNQRWTRTGRFMKPSPCTAKPAIARYSPSMTTPTRTGSRSTSTNRERNGRPPWHLPTPGTAARCRVLRSKPYSEPETDSL
jgi:DNA-binding MarR family transcriptional regulator